MELVHADTVVDVLEPGQCFGHPSLLTGLAPAFTVRAREASTRARCRARAALRVFAQPAGAEYLRSACGAGSCVPATPRTACPS